MKNRQEGLGIFIHPNGDYYRGDWINGVPHGTGQLMQVTEYYKKAFDRTSDTIEDIEHWANRSKYEGEFRFGEKHGKGKLTW